jgi:hypothetical protein
MFDMFESPLEERVGNIDANPMSQRHHYPRIEHYRNSYRNVRRSIGPVIPDTKVG